MDDETKTKGGIPQAERTFRMSRGDLEQHFKWMNHKRQAEAEDGEATFRVSREEILRQFEALAEAPPSSAILSKPSRKIEFIEIEEIEALEQSAVEMIEEGLAIEGPGPQSNLQCEKMLHRRIAGGRYHLQELIGRGGMGAVFRATQTAMDRSVALKLIVPNSPVSAKRFEREAKIVSQLRHPNTVTVFDYGVLDSDTGIVFLAMEFLDGKPLSKLIRDEAPLPVHRIINIAVQICRSLNEAHERGVIHRDIKPDNIFLTEVDGDRDFVKVLDFGVAKAFGDEFDVNLTEDGRAVGTPRYMPPEQILGRPVDARSDIYSLGCILYEMLSGGPPFAHPSRTAVMLAHVQETVPPFSGNPLTQAKAPSALEKIVLHALEKDPEDRPRSTREMREMLEKVAAGLDAPRAESQSEHPTLTGGPISSDFLAVHTTEDRTQDDILAPISARNEFARSATAQAVNEAPQEIVEMPSSGENLAPVHEQTPSPKPKNRTLVMAIVAVMVLIAILASTMFLT